jgi:hypothetical protein
VRDATSIFPRAWPRPAQSIAGRHASALRHSLARFPRLLESARPVRSTEESKSKNAFTVRLLLVCLFPTRRRASFYTCMAYSEELGRLDAVVGNGFTIPMPRREKAALLEGRFLRNYRVEKCHRVADSTKFAACSSWPKASWGTTRNSKPPEASSSGSISPPYLRS